ncbi:MAG: ABC transporter ATP-binding protein [Acetobacteraceae bacterium]|nr:ABC transporter ATP-binding protein [Acetobacteraceae bacterium]
MSVVAELRGVSVELGDDDRRVAALTRIDLQVAAGQILGVAGESGAGKSTLARTLLRLVQPQAGTVLLEGNDITAQPERRLRRLRGRMTMTFRNPLAVLNPRMTVRALLEEPLRLHARLTAPARRAAVEALAERLRLRAGELELRPAELDAGRAQLVGLGRAIATQPRLLVLDEPTCELDTVAAAEFLALLASLRDSADMAIVLIGHDITALQPVADRIAVLYLGEIVEEGPTADLLRDALHPYSQALLSAHLPADPTRRGRRIRLRGEAPTPDDRTPGCGFAPRCPIAENRCRSGAPTPNQIGTDRRVACLRVLEGSSRIPLTR